MFVINLTGGDDVSPQAVMRCDCRRAFHADGVQSLAVIEYDNAFKIQWELFIKHVVLDTPWRYSLMEGAKGEQLAELGMQSWKERKWVDVPELG